MNATTNLSKRSGTSGNGNAGSATGSSATNGTRLFGSYTLSDIDFEAMMDSQRKTMAALAQIRQSALSGVQEAQRRQLELVHQTMDTHTAMLSNLATQSGSLTDWIETQTEASKQTIEKAIEGARGVAEVIAQFNIEAITVMGKRFSESLSEMGNATAAGRAAAR